jgi:hypothetical protein
MVSREKGKITHHPARRLLLIRPAKHLCPIRMMFGRVKLTAPVPWLDVDLRKVSPVLISCESGERWSRPSSHPGDLNPILRLHIRHPCHCPVWYHSRSVSCLRDISIVSPRMTRRETDIATPADHIVVTLPQWATWGLWGVKAKVVMAREIDFSAVGNLCPLVNSYIP